MAPHLDRLAYEVVQAKLRKDGYGLSIHQDPSAEASVKATRGTEEVYVTLFTSGTIRINPDSNSQVKKLRDDTLSELNGLRADACARIGARTFDFLEELDRENVLVSRKLCDAPPDLIEYSALVMPLAKAYEGFAKKLLVQRGFGDPSKIKPDFFRDAFNSPAYKALTGPDKAALERVRDELPFCRHKLMHSPPPPGFVLRDRDQALAKEGDILTLMREIGSHFGV